MSIVHRFRYNELFMFAGNDVTAISSLGGASGNFWSRILKGRPRFYILVQFTLCVYLKRFRRYSTFFYLAGISLLGAKFRGFWGKMTPKKIKFRKTLKGTFLRQNASSKLMCVKICSRAWAVRVAKNKKNKKNNNKSHTTPKYHYHVGAPPLIWSQPNLAWLVNPGI